MIEFVMTPEWGTLVWIIATTLVLCLMTLRFLTSRNQKILYLIFVLCFFLYNGYGAAYPHGVYNGYGTMYIVFLSVLSLGYVFFLKLLRKELHYAQQGTIGLLTRLFENRFVVNASIGIYLGLILFPLCYPEFRLGLLFNPPAPDIEQEFLARFTLAPGTLTKIVQALSYIVFPFYLLAVTYYRNNFLLFSSILALPYYILYCAQSYIGRSEILALLVIIFAMQWYFRPRLRKYLMVFAFIMVPVIPTTLIWYQEIRVARSPIEVEVSTGDALKYLLYSETMFPILSEKVISSDKHIDLKRYFIWLATLPIPKGIIGSVNPPSAGMEMSEILLGLRQGQKDFFALLAGLLTESVYVYGLKFYFIHALMIGLVMAIVVRLTENEPLLFIIFLSIVLDLTYKLNRAGIGAALPAVVNLYFALYILFFLGYLKKRWRVQ